MKQNKICSDYHRCYAEINLSTLENNFKALKGLVKPGVKVCCVIKADAYGHGAVQVARLLETQADYFAVAELFEALELREAGILKPILILSYSSPLEYQTAIENDVTMTVYDYNDAKLISETALSIGRKAKIHVAVDTGMNRIGFSDCLESAEKIRDISALDGIELEGLFSHYAKADYRDKENANKQTERFDNFIELLEKLNVNIPIKHICNSAGIIELEKQYDMVRMGIALYGLYPSDEVRKDKVKLSAVMSIYSHVIFVKKVKKGESIGYGQIYTAETDRIIATVSIGYADGYSRCLTGKGWVLIHGKKAPIRGKICMDQIMVDVTDIPHTHVGDRVVMLGKSGEEELNAETLGELSHSFNYEVVCTFMPRLKRYYTED